MKGRSGVIMAGRIYKVNGRQYRSVTFVTMSGEVLHSMKSNLQ